MILQSGSPMKVLGDDDIFFYHEVHGEHEGSFSMSFMVMLFCFVSL